MSGRAEGKCVEDNERGQERGRRMVAKEQEAVPIRKDQELRRS